jgi:VID27 N-terminal region/VID27 C-terminal WD40-like domain/VID27 PH-like domain
MFMVNRLGKWFFGDTSKESIIEIPDGQLYIVRPLSLKGYSELIYKDARATIRRTSTEHNYQLVITRVYEEGEEELLEDEAGEDGDVDLNKDEQSFLLDEALQFRVDIRDTGEKVFAWRDLSGGKGDLWEFVCAASTKAETVESFELVAVRCQYERKFKSSAEHASEQDLQRFLFTDEPIPAASPVLKPSSRSPTISPSPTSARLTSDAAEAEAMCGKLSGKGVAVATPAAPEAAQAAEPSHPVGRETYSRETAELHLFDFESSTFVQQEQAVEAIVMELGNWDYWLKIAGQSRSWIGRTVEDDINPVFNFEYLSAIFNVYHADHSAHSYLLRFKDQAQLERFQQGLMRALWEHNNQMRWAKLKEDDQDYVLDAFKDLVMEDVPEEPEDEEDDEEDVAGPVHQSEEYDSDESQDDVEGQPKDGNVNSQLAVGYKHDRAFVVRGSKIGVFKHTADDNSLNFVTNISKVQTPKGQLFSPKKVMLHAGDSNMILQNEANPNSVYRMDLEVGKIVDEWKVHDDIPINAFAPETVSWLIFARFQLIWIEIRPDDGSANLPRPVQERNVPRGPPTVR